MKKHLESFKSRLQILNVFFKVEDYIVFNVSLFCLFWICLYKLSWSSTEQLFNNADKVADITYTVFSSFIAAGIFYLFTIYIPNKFKIKRMNEYLTYSLSKINKGFVEYISDINKGETNEKYTVESFKESLLKDLNSTKKDFISYNMNPVNSSNFKEVITIQNNYLNGLLLMYSDLLPRDLALCLNDFCSVKIKSVKIDSKVDNTFTSTQNFYALNFMFHLLYMLENYLNKKYEDIL